MIVRLCFRLSLFLLLPLPISLFAQEPEAPLPLFTFVEPEQSGVMFRNMVIEDDTFNVNEFIYAYNGGGVAAGDVNGDRLPDLYFSGTRSGSPNRLYLNRGGFRFEDVSERAGVDDSIGVRYGVAMIDIDGDRDLDIYVSKHDAPNTLFLNDGHGVFTEAAARFGLDLCCHSTQASFLDYDRDGDVDMYLGINGSGKGENFVRDGDPDRLFRNNGDGSFSDVSAQAGISDIGYCLSVSVGDLNGDGWPDIYVANDFEARDILYLNNRDGTFTNAAKSSMKHTSIFSMGSDIADYNNDGALDVITMDMRPEDHWRKMAHMGTSSPYSSKFDSLQLMRNTLQLNRGDGTFMDIGQIAGISETDWSWASLFADFDNDGLKDLLIVNGYKRDVQNLDVIYNLSSRSFRAIDMILKIPSIKLQNYLFRNNGDLTFTRKSDEWGMGELVNSNGAAYVDLDLDGDLDVVMNNIDSVAFIYRCTATEQGLGNFLDVELRGTGRNSGGAGARVTVVGGGRRQVQECSPTRGYLSAMHGPLHFGLGREARVDSVLISWPDGSTQTLLSVEANRTLVVKQEEAVGGDRERSGPRDRRGGTGTMFRETAGAEGIDFRHIENVYDDFLQERLLPNRLSRNGPGIAAGDVDGDGRDDLYLCGAQSSPGGLFLQTPQGGFVRSKADSTLSADSVSEDLGAIFFDVEGDGDQDLYIVTGGNERVVTRTAEPVADSLLYDRLYLNDGRGGFTRAVGALPALPVSGSCAAASDYDGDGDLDLFVAGRVTPGRYPIAPGSALLRNDGGRFTDVTASVAPGLLRAGMITSALWTDFDNDADGDLLLVGEWTTPTLFRNDNGSFIDITASTGVDSAFGWWNSVAGGDFDNDGDIDYVLGNLGLNVGVPYHVSTRTPIRLYANDFDENGSLDIVMSYIYRGTEYPLRNRNDVASQMPAMIRRKFTTYTAYAGATLAQIYAKAKLDSAIRLSVTGFASVMMRNMGKGRFELLRLPVMAQVTPIFGMMPEDFNDDGNLDLLAVGNFHGPDADLVRYDAGYGTLLFGGGDGGFTAPDPFMGGFEVPGDARSLSCIPTGDAMTVVAANNNGRVQTFRKAAAGTTIRIDPRERITHALLTLEDGRVRRTEIYIGEGYLSQRPAAITAGPKVRKVELYRGRTLVRTVDR